jgi:hypothetical protein
MILPGKCVILYVTLMCAGSQPHPQTATGSKITRFAQNAGFGLFSTCFRASFRSSGLFNEWFARVQSCKRVDRAHCDHVAQSATRQRTAGLQKSNFGAPPEVPSYTQKQLKMCKLRVFASRTAKGCVPNLFRSCFGVIKSTQRACGRDLRPEMCWGTGRSLH